MERADLVSAITHIPIAAEADWHQDGTTIMGCFFEMPVFTMFMKDMHGAIMTCDKVAGMGHVHDGRE